MILAIAHVCAAQAPCKWAVGSALSPSDRPGTTATGHVPTVHRRSCQVLRTASRAAAVPVTAVWSKPSAHGHPVAGLIQLSKHTSQHMTESRATCGADSNALCRSAQKSSSSPRQARAALVLHISAPDPTRADSLVGILEHDSMPKHACNAAASETEQPIATLGYGVTAGVQQASLRRSAHCAASRSHAVARV